MKGLKRGSCVLFTLLLALSCFTGCTSLTKKNAAQAVNEVLTLRPYDTSKQVITISVTDGINYDSLYATLSEQFPEISFVLRPGSQTEAKIRSNTDDIYLVIDASLVADVERNLLDLSAFECAGKYYSTSLQSCSSINDGKQYLLPLPGVITGIVYNKTLFAENGWQVPHSKSEFFELCHTIQASGIVERAFQPSIKYSDGVINIAEMFNESNLFSTLEYYQWFEDFASTDDTSSAFVLKPIIECFQELLDEEIITLADFEMKPGERSKMMYKERSAAMTIETQLVTKYALDQESTDEFGLFPFYSGDSAQDGFVKCDPIAYVCISSKLGEAGNEAKLKTVQQILDFFSTEAGMACFVEEGGFAASQLKDVKVKFPTSSIYADVQEAIDAGRMVQLSPIMKRSMGQGKTVLNEVINSVFDTARHSTTITGDETLATFEQAVAYADTYNRNLKSKSPREVETIYATVTEPFTVLETSEYMAQMLMEQSGAELSLFLCNSRYRGNTIAFYQGDQVKTTADSIQPYDVVASFDFTRGGTPTDENDFKMATVKMTGSQILQALEDSPYDNEGWFQAFYVGAGLKIEFAPWAQKGSRYINVALADGSPLEPDRLYTVAIWNNTVKQEYITEYVKIHEGQFADLLRTQMMKDKVISPVEDGRFTLNWNIVATEAENTAVKNEK
ncbi:MAG: 5'-nucleotidase C-terminal domain-containing protein [Oscillospiraceae bacterium]|nr:5'-nucleotidase C-terminal domain-containing protein [Oscillospiraceae bacterium]